MSSDKKTIGLTEANKAVIETMTIEREWFRDQLDAAKFAMALAINVGIEPGTAEGTGTVWNVGSFDPEGELRELMHIIYPDVDAPYRLVEHLLNIGLEIIGERLAENPYTNLVELMTQAAAG